MLLAHATWSGGALKAATPKARRNPRKARFFAAFGREKCVQTLLLTLHSPNITLYFPPLAFSLRGDINW
jgi:hypothetical protein